MYIANRIVTPNQSSSGPSKGLHTHASLYLSLGLLGVVALYLVFAPRFNAVFYRPLLFHPWRIEHEPIAPPISGVTGENVYFPSANGKTLNGWYYKNPTAKVTVLFSHGNGGNVSVRADLVELLLKAGASVFIYDYEGYGESAGKPTVDGICEDGVGAYNYLTNVQKVRPESLVLYGESLGAAVAAYLTTRFDCKGLILQSGFSSLRRIACEVFPVLIIYPDLMYPTPNLDTASILAQRHPPLLLMHGIHDNVIPYEHVKTLYAAASGIKELVTLNESGHGDLYSTAGDTYTRAIRAFLVSLDTAKN